MNDDYRYASYVPTKGTRWEYEETVMELLQRVDLLSDHYDACGMPVICDGQTAYVSSGDSHGLILGSTGAKKTRLFSMPMMQMFARAGESVLCADPRGELYEKTSGLFAQEGYHVQVINLSDPSRSHGWNPLALARHYYGAGRIERAAVLINELTNCLFSVRLGTRVDHSMELAVRAIFQGLLQLLVEGVQFFPDEQVGIASLPALQNGLLGGTVKRDGSTNRMVLELPGNSLAKSSLRAILTLSEDHYDSLELSYNALLQVLFSQQSLIRMLSKEEVDFSLLGKRKTVIFLIMPDDNTSLHVLASLIVKQCFEVLSETAKQQGGVLPVRVNFLLDEFSDLPTIPDINSMISAARSRNIRFYLVAQSMQQLLNKYGDDAYAIRGNCNDWAFLTSRELTLLEELEKLCGVDMQTGQPLISVSQLQRLDKERGEALILCNRMYPYIAHLADIDDYPFASAAPLELPTLRNVPEPLRDADTAYAAYLSSKLRT